MFLMPSLYEPCGLNQMYSMRYGTVPIVRATGGLDDTVQQFNPQMDGNGFKFGLMTPVLCLKKYAKPFTFMRGPNSGKRFSTTEC